MNMNNIEIKMGMQSLWGKLRMIDVPKVTDVGEISNQSYQDLHRFNAPKGTRYQSESSRPKSGFEYPRLMNRKRSNFNKRNKGIL